MNISAEARRILVAMSEGNALRSYRNIEGEKSFRLISITGEVELVNDDIVKALRAQGFIDSNKKFPVAAFWLTDQGKRTANVSE